MNHKTVISVFVSLLILAGLVLGACSLLPGATPATTANNAVPTVVSNAGVIIGGNLAPRDYKYLSFATGGKVAEILVKKGEAVTAGQVLARLGNREQGEAALASAQLELTSVQQALDNLNRTASLAKASNELALLQAQGAVIAAGRAWDAVDTTDFQKKIDDAATEEKNRKDDLKTAQDDFDQYKDLSADNATRKSYEDKLKKAQKDYDEAVRKHDDLTNQHDQAKASLDKATAAVTEAQRTYTQTQNGPDPDQLALLQARQANAKAQAAAAQAGLDNLDLKAPFAGTVVDLNVVANEQVGTSTWAVLVADFSEWYVETKDLTELDVVKIGLGKNATVKPDALPDLQLTGKVTEIGNMFQEKGGDIIYHARLLVAEPPDPRLRWGMTVEITFEK